MPSRRDVQAREDHVRNTVVFGGYFEVTEETFYRVSKRELVSYVKANGEQLVKEMIEAAEKVWDERNPTDRVLEGIVVIAKALENSEESRVSGEATNP